MLPTKGYFQDIECPYFNSSCGRPYCHFRHKKKASETLDDASIESEKEETVVPTYKPTPKSELANRSHIPISYVPDLAFRSERKSRPKIEKPTYKPTPLSILSSANKRLSICDENGENIAAIKEIKQNIANVEYDPTTVSVQSTNDINFEDLSSEFDLIDEIINEKAPSSSNNKTLLKNVSTLGTIKNKNNSKSNEGSKVQQKLSDKNIDKIEKKVLEKNELTAKITDDTKISSSKNIQNQEKLDRSNSEKSKKNEKTKEAKLEHLKEKNKSESSTKKKNIERQEEKTKPDTKTSASKEPEAAKDFKILNKHKTKDKKRDQGKSESKSEKSNKSDRDKHRKEEHKGRVEKEKTHSSHKKHKSRERSRSHNRSNSLDSNTSHKQNKSHDRNSSKTRSKSKERQKNEIRNKQKSLSKTSKNKSESKHHLDGVKDKEKTRKRVQENKEPINIFRLDGDDYDDYLGNNSFSNLDKMDIDLSDVDLEDNDEETMLECYKIFNEYKPPENYENSSQETAEIETSLVEQELSEYGSSSSSNRKRVAHANVEMTYSQLHPPVKPKTVITPGQLLTNRYKVSLLARANKLQESSVSEFQQPAPPKRSAPTLLEAARAQKIRREQTLVKPSKPPKPASLIDEILQESAKPISKTILSPSPTQLKPIVKKIAPAQNVSLLAQAKERLSKIKQKPISAKTIAQTQKIGSRVAHIPEVSLSDIPDVLQADKSKLPVNVRTRFLTLIADECVKMYISKEEAYTRALSEEFACYEKCKVLVSYRNSAMLAVNRLRKEVQERKTMGLGLIGIGESSSKDPSSNFMGNKFYKAIKKWLLTEEDLDIHGYPRESEKQHGCVVIKNSKRVLPSNLDENQRYCVRCKRIYQVDDDGWPLFEEECIYHPLKKRTIRGEQIYLCCGSNIETGCATSDTHVSEGFSSAELEGFMTTMKPESDDDPRSYSVYALDCEMCYTTKGLELTRVTIIDTECKTVYESLVKPLNPIIDYNTRFSGITKEQMDRTSTSILQIQANILHLCNSKTILIGHSLESDMKALKIVHGSVVDTSVLFPHKMGLPHKRALKALASEYLRKIIQNNVSGHDSAEDAVTCMELVKWKLKEELKSR